jgi:hypothetical protein
MGLLDTIYIVSKGRPECWTAQYLDYVKYPDDWFIVCGSNDDTLPEYIDRWGDERVIVFDHPVAAAMFDPMDAFGDSKPSGVMPARNVVRNISHARGELRHWIFDDDYRQVVAVTDDCRYPVLDGAELHGLMADISAFGQDGGISVVGFGINTIANSRKMFRTFDTKVFNCMNVANERPLFQPWRGRLFEDWVHSLDDTCRGTGEICFEHLYVECVNNPWGLDGKQTPGGLKDLYESDEKAVTNIRECGYCLMVAPGAVTLTTNPNAYREFGKRAAMSQLLPKRISSKWSLTEGDRQ